MKKQLFIGLAALGLLASCSNDEIVEQSIAPQAAIGFDGAFVNNSTRATANDDLSKKILTSGFGVYGDMNNPTDQTSNVAKIFENQQVSYDGSKYTYDPLRYWTPGNNYSFSAFAPYGGNWTFTDNVTTTNYSKPHGSLDFTNANGNVDLGYAFATRSNATYNETPVNLTFNHLLSQVKVKFTNSFDSEGAALIIKDLKITSAGGGNYDLSQLNTVSDGNNITNTNIQNTVWTFDGQNSNGLTVNYQFTIPGQAAGNVSDSFSNKGNAETSNFFYLMPSQTSITIEFNVELISNGVTNGNWNHSVDVSLSENGQLVFKPGCSYTLVADLNAQNVADEALNPIEFTATTNDWINAGEVNIPLLGLNANKINLNVDETFQVVPTTTCGSLTEGTGDGTYSVAYAYASDDDAVATVSNDGLITAVAAGTANVTVTATITKASGGVFTRSKDIVVTVAAAAQP